MSVSPGHLDGLLNLTFSDTNYSGLAAQSGTATSLTASATGADDPGVSIDIVAVDDSANTITADASQDGAFIGEETVYVVGYSSTAILLSELDPATTFSDGETPSTYSALDQEIAVISSTPIAAETSITFTANGSATFAKAPLVVNSAGGQSYLYVYNPSSTVLETITEYSGLNATGTVISTIVDDTDGTSLVYSYNPSSTVKQTTQEWSATNPANGAPAGTEISDVVDNSDGTSLVYAYNPTSTVKQTAQEWSATNSANGAPAGREISDVVDNTNGTVLVYAYNPSSTVTQTTELWSATNSANGAPAGTKISDVVDNTDGTSIVYAYNPSSTVTQTATYYSSSDPSTGAPTGMKTSETIDYTSGGSSITTYLSNGSSNTVNYNGPNGTGGVVTPPKPLVAMINATNLTLSPMKIITPSGTSDKPVGPVTYGDLFKGTAAMMNQDIVQNFGGTDQIDLTDILFSKTGHSWTPGTDGGGTLRLSDGTHSTALNMQGHYTASSFAFTTDGAGGTLITYA